jgi:hypothetical protein
MNIIAPDHFWKNDSSKNGFSADGGPPASPAEAVAIDSFDLHAGWRKIVHPAARGTPRELGRTYLRLGNRYSFEVTVHASENEGYLIDLCGYDTLRQFWVSNLPSLLTILPGLSTAIQAQQVASLNSTMTKLLELAVEREGPLFAAQQGQIGREEECWERCTRREGPRMSRP